MSRLELLVAVAIVAPALVLRVCRPGPIPRRTPSWFDVLPTLIPRR